MTDRQQAVESIKVIGLLLVIFGGFLALLSLLGLFAFGITLILFGAFLRWVVDFDKDNPPAWITKIDDWLEKRRKGGDA